MANVAGIRLSIEGGADLAEAVNPRLLELTLSEKREAEADELNVTLQNHDGLLATPEPGVALLLALGWKTGDENTPVGLVDKGRFLVDEVELSGPPDVVTIRARSADLSGPYRQRRTRSWRDTTLGAILGEIAGRHGRTARIAGGLADRAVATIEQEGKSDMAFVADLGRRYDAIATWKGGYLIFAPIGLSASVGGKAMDGLTLAKQDGWAWTFRQASRDAHDGAEAQWHDQDAGRRRTVRVGGENGAQAAEGGSAPSIRRLRRVYASEEEARQAANASASRDARAPFSFDYALAVADPAISPDQRVRLRGWSGRIDGIEWLVESVETRLGPGGFTQQLKLESA